MERTLTPLKPDAVHRGRIGRVPSGIEAKGRKLVALKMRRVIGATEPALFFPDADEASGWTPVEDAWVYAGEER